MNLYGSRILKNWNCIKKNYGNHGDDKSSFNNENQNYEVKEDSSEKSNNASEKYKSHFILNKNENGNKNEDSEEKCVGFEEENEKLYPKDYSSATYYLASNMTIQDNEKQALLEAENIIVRLRWEILTQITSYYTLILDCRFWHIFIQNHQNCIFVIRSFIAMVTTFSK